MALAYQVTLPDFQGPLDLLLHLIRSQEMDIHHLPVALLVDQYQIFLKKHPEIDLTQAGEYAYMLCILMNMKARMLLPRGELEAEGEDPRSPFVSQLLTYESLRKAKEVLQERWQLTQHMHPRHHLMDVHLEEISLYDLVASLAKVLSKKEKLDQIVPLPEPLPPMERFVHWIESYLETAKGACSLEEVLNLFKTRQEVIAAFIALLEMVKAQKIRLSYATPQRTILVRLHPTHG